jgi:RNA polymerase sigma factor (sigma-70 family)
MSDTELLHEYLATGSEPAFAALVERYINLVYSAARRQVRDVHMAEDITQAVFIIPARNAGRIRNPAMLGAWLLKTARQTSCNAIRLERCRRRHELEAATMKSEQAQSVAEPAAARIEGVVDEFLSRLGERDRGALILRYLQGKSVDEVAVALHVSPPAAQKRITRALFRLKDLLARRGIATAGDALEQGLGSQVLHAAPLGLALLVSSGAIGKAAGAGQLLAHATVRTLFWAKVRALALGLVASGAAVTIVATVAVNSMPATRASAADTGQSDSPAAATTAPTAALAPVAAAPVAAASEFPAVHLANDAFHASGPADVYLNELDPDTLRTPDSAPAGHIKSLNPDFPDNNVYAVPTRIIARRYYNSPLDKVRGRRIRVSGWIKTNDVRDCAGLAMYAYDDGGGMVMCDQTAGVRPIHGSTDWRKYEMVQDVPRTATRIALGADLYCSGELWMDDFEVEVVGNDVPCTDDQYWHITSPFADQYSFADDAAEQRNGHATTCFRSKTALRGEWAMFEHLELHPDPKFLGHRIRMTAWMKSTGVTGKSGLGMGSFGSWDKQIGSDGQRGHRPIVGSQDWQQYTAFVDVPMDTKSMDWEIIMNGRGKIWIDLDSVQFDLADDASNPPAAPAP